MSDRVLRNVSGDNSAVKTKNHSTFISDGAGFTPAHLSGGTVVLSENFSESSEMIAAFASGATIGAIGNIAGGNAKWIDTGGIFGGGYYNTVISATGSSDDITIEGGVVTSNWLWGASTYQGSATIIVDDGAVINGVAVSSGAVLSVARGGAVDNAVIYGSAALTAGPGGVVNGVVANLGTVFASGSGAVVNNVIAENLGAAIAVSGGMINGGNGGGASGANSGTFLASSGGIIEAGDHNHNVVSGTATNGGTLLAESGGTVLGGLIAGYDSELDQGAPAYGTVGNGGVFSDLTARQGGRIAVDSGGLISNIKVLGGALADAQESGATIYGGTAYGTAGENGGYPAGGVMAAGAGGAVVIGGTASNEGIIVAGVSGATAGGTVFSGGTITVGANGDLASLIGANNGAGAVISDATFYSGATLYSSGNSGFFGTYGGGSGLVAGAIYSNITFESGQALAARQGSMFGATASAGAGAAFIGSGVYASGATAIGSMVNGSSLAASIDALNGGTIYAGTAASGGVLAAGGIAKFNNNPLVSILSGGNDSGLSLVSGGHILNGGLGVAGGNSNLTVRKNGSSVTVDGAGMFSDAVVDAGGIMDVNGSGLLQGGTVAGYALGESGGTISGVLFSGAADGGYQGVNAYINAGATAVGNQIQSGALLSVGGGLAMGNTVLASGMVEVGAGYSHYVRQGSNGDLALHTGADLAYGTSISAVIENGGTQLVVSSGVASDTKIMSGGIVSVSAAGTDALATIFHGATMIVDHSYTTGALVSGYTSNNGVADDTVIANDGIQIIGDKGIGARATIESAGILSIEQGAQQLGVLVKQGGTLIVNSGGAAMEVKIGAGMDKWVGPPSDGSVTDNLGQDGGIIHAGGLLLGGDLEDGQGTGSTVEQMGGLLRVERGATVTALHMGNYGQIEVMGVQYGAGESVVYTNNQIILMSDHQSVWGAMLDNSVYNPSSFQVWGDGGTAVIVYDQCFLRGTLISTKRGEIEVQNLKEGDTVWAIVDNQEVERRITAFHSEKSSIHKNLPVDLAGWSVCIKKGAFGEGLPKRDLRVTPEHSFFFQGRFVPVRMLVNGRTIYYDTLLEDFEFFHFETLPHSIIRAEGVLTESWLNTEERCQAVNLSAGVIRLERLSAHSWEKDAAAPLDVSANFVGALWKKFAERAVRENIPVYPSQMPNFTKDPALRVCLDNGKLLKPLNQRGNQYFFQIPPGTKAQSLFSKKFRPCESVGPWMDDRRQLGVLVGKITVAVGGIFRLVNAHHHIANLSGWDVVENSPCRWTNGNAALPFLGTEEELCFGASLIIEILAGGPYPDQEENILVFEAPLKKEA